ncbi:MAG: SDR family oxidoreductase [Bacteroidetes bacterium]|nr:SDR family oxidoreductase [Bacteroidota bacterium]
MDFKNKVVWITGASSGIGEALAYSYAKQGAKLILSARRAVELERVKSNCDNPEQVFVLPLDLMEVPSLEAKVKEAVDVFGRVDVLVNNGGISQRSLSVTTPLEIDRKIMEINYFSYVAITKALLPFMMEQKSGYIIVTSSILGKIGVELRSAYSASKHALHGFFDSLREELRHHNIHVMLVCPGYIKTNVTFHALTETGETYNKMGDGQEKGMLPEQCAEKIIQAAKKRKNEIYIGGFEILTVYLKRYMPDTYLKIVRQFKTT